mmetsp:Transcript_93902/g.265269  ORF Transcript_93902/g.265269 Transcript_93902/m.265269 type:complete len:281 (-) Transcript_93902:9-851(-)
MHACHTHSWIAKAIWWNAGQSNENWHLPRVRLNRRSLFHGNQGCRGPVGLRGCGRRLAHFRGRCLVNRQDLLQIGALDDGALRGLPDAISQRLLVLEVADEFCPISQLPRTLLDLAILPVAVVCVFRLAEDVGALALALVTLPEARIDVAVGIRKGAFPLALATFEVTMVEATLLVGEAAQSCFQVVLEAALEHVPFPVFVEPCALTHSVLEEALVDVASGVRRSALASESLRARFLSCFRGQSVGRRGLGKLLVLLSHRAFGSGCLAESREARASRAMA